MSTVNEQVSVLRSKQLMERARRCIPGGVNSPVRAYSAVGGAPRFIRAAQGAYLFDEDSNRYIDYVGAWGAMILGHAHPAVIQRVQAVAERGLSFGAPSELELALSEKIIHWVPSVEQVRMMNSGTEATMTAIRLARAATHRNKIVTFEGCYHGHADPFLVKAGSGSLTLGVPSSPGVPPACAADTLTAAYNDLDSVTALFEAEGQHIAALILEPVPGNMGLLLPTPSFIEALRAICDQYGSLLIFDEVMTGFRISPSGFQGLSSVRPDLTTLGKVMGGGMPIGACGGSAELMEQLSPAGPVYQAGTFSGNPLSMAAGLAALTELEKPGSYEQLLAMTQQWAEGLLERARAAGVPLVVNYCTGMFSLFFTEQEKVACYQDVMRCDKERFKRFFHAMLQEGVYLSPSPYEAGFISLAHSAADIEYSLMAAERAFC